MHHFAILQGSRMLEHKEFIDDRHLGAQEIFIALQKFNASEHEIQFATLLLYFVASLILESSPSEKEDSIFVKRDPGKITELMTHLIRENELGSASQLLDQLDYELISNLINQLQTLQSKKINKKGFALFVYDFIFERLLASHEISLDHSRIVATFANSLTKSRASIVEAFPYSGEVAINAREIGADREIYFSEFFGYPFMFQSLVSLRMKLYGLDWEFPRSNQFEYDVHKNLTLVDGAQEILGCSKTYSSIDALLDLIETDDLTDLALVILSRLQCQNVPEQILRKVIGGDLLEAVVDFCSVDHKGNQVSFTAWVLNKNKEQERETLFLDATPLIDSGGIRAIWFASAVIDRWRGAMFKFESRHYTKHFDDRLKNLFSIHLEHEFRELPGFITTCETSSLTEGDKLTARDAIKRNPAETDFFTLEHAGLVEKIVDSNTPTCIYVIGDNGAGKSLLLRNLIPVLDANNIDSVGIAFSPIDRFPFTPLHDSLFVYEGARARSSPEKDHSHSYLANLLLDIYLKPLRLASFKKSLETLGFNRRLFLIPLADPDNPVSDWERMLATIELHGDLLPPNSEINFEPGVQHQEDGPIIKVSSLSSGEQQLLSLLIKICVYADHHTTFLIDEPEISMHVRWQQQIPQLLAAISDEYECSFVVATHSPLIIANARTQDTCYLARDKVLNEILPYQRHSVESILLDGFNTYTPDSREINDRCAVLVSRAIQAKNQPGDTDPHLKSKLIDSLKRMNASLKASTSDKKNDSFKKDLNLVRQAKKAVIEVFDGAKKRKPTRD
jgi:hypothetical protein